MQPDFPVHYLLTSFSLGSALIARNPNGICAISLGDDAESLVRELKSRFGDARLISGDEGDAELEKVAQWLEHPTSEFDGPLDLRGSAFQLRVWQALREIPPGSTATYTQIAQKIGAPKSVRAVAGACAANTLAVAIPCHRVVRSDGTLSGYRWGVERKRELLQREKESQIGA